jgi:hypothetical protein
MFKKNKGCGSWMVCLINNGEKTSSKEMDKHMCYLYHCKTLVVNLNLEMMCLIIRGRFMPLLLKVHSLTETLLVWSEQCSQYCDMLLPGQCEGWTRMEARLPLSRMAPRPTQPVQWVPDKAAEGWCWTHHSLQLMRLQMGWSYTSISPLCLHRHVTGWPLIFMGKTNTR